MTLECLTSLFEMIDLPPPGMPMADMKKRSTTDLKSNSSMSYHPPWSYHWRSSSRIGCAPYFSFLGMFKSSTSTSPFLLLSGPRMPAFLLFNLGPSVLWMAITPVWALKERVTAVYRDAGNMLMSVSQFNDLPVPVPPHFSTCMCDFNNDADISIYLVESSVGTTISS